MCFNSQCVKTTVVCRFVCSVKTHHDRQLAKCKEQEAEKEREQVERVRITARGRERQSEHMRKREMVEWPEGSVH